jgi:N-acetylneuraminic acid mutarotase
MKNVYKLFVVVLFAAWIIEFTGCKKDAEDPPVTAPVITTAAISGITKTSAVTGGYVSYAGGAEVIYRGVCWDIVHNPTVAGNKTTDGRGSGNFSSTIAGLTVNTTYYVRAYGTTNAGTTYGNEISFITTDQVTIANVVTSITITEITDSSAVSGGNITSDGGATVTDYGVCWSTSENPTTDNDRYNITGGSGVIGIFSSPLKGLKPITTYFVRAYAINSVGIAYGNQYSFTTSSRASNGIRKADFPGVSISGWASFSIGTKVYVGMGYDDGDNPTREFWQWDQTANIWTRKADFPGSLQAHFVCFQIGTKGYVETGSTYYAYNNLTIPNEFWEYDPETNSWAQKATIPVVPGRTGAIGFSIGSKGYIGMGVKAEGMFNSYYEDFWEWDQGSNIWTKKADFPGNIRTLAVAFSIGNKGYIGTGSDGITFSREFWEWDQATNVWSRKADFGGIARYRAVGFSLGNKGYIGLGKGAGPGSTTFEDIWEWDQATNVWKQKADFRGSARYGAIGLSCGSKGYIGMGNNDIGNLTDFWEYDPNLK